MQRPLLISACFFSPRRMLSALLSAAILHFVAPPAVAEIHTFRLVAPEAREVYLAGEMTGWDSGKRAMQRDATGAWTLDVDLGQGQWLYKFVVDGRWMADPAGDANDADGQGGHHSFVFVGDGPWKEQAGVAHGRVESFHLPSRVWGQPMKTNVYLPPGYKRGEAYPVLLLLHGMNMDADQWYRTGHIERYLDNLLAAGRIKPFVVVMPSSADVNYTGKSERFIMDELLPWLNATYGLEVHRPRSAVAGMSMGGFGAFHLPRVHPDRFGFGFALSGFYPSEYIMELPQTALPTTFMMICGSEDGLVGNNRALARQLKERGARFYYHESPGAHTFQYWSLHTEEMLLEVNRYFTGGTNPHNEDSLGLAETKSLRLPRVVIGTEVRVTPELRQRLTGVWRGHWQIVPGGLKGRYEENVRALDDAHYEGVFTVAEAGPQSRIDEPFNLRLRTLDGRLNYTSEDGASIETIVSEKDGRLWRQWMVEANGLDILIQVQKDGKP